MAFTIIRKINTAALVSLLTISSAFNAYAAPGVLPTIPIYDTNPGVEPNVFFTVDDSGSMDWELIFKQGVTGIPTDQGLPIINGDRRRYMIPSWENNLVPSLANDPNSWIFRNFVANPVYYNSELIYEPWRGYKDDDETIRMYENANPEKVREHPDQNGGTLDITKNVANRYLPTFCLWGGDTNANGGIDPADDHTCVEIKPGNEAQFPSGRSYEEEISNFANWMQYYRKREYAAKQAIGSVIQATEEARMGMRLINSGLVENLKTMTDTDNKRKLLEEYYEDNASGGTPLRSSLRTVGEMFKSPGAILPQAEGGECQQNFNILMTDGYWNGGNPSGIGNEDGDNNTIWDGNKDQNVDKGNFGDGASDTLADVAMYYYENDLSPLANKVPTTADVDLADHQHLVNYTIAFGLTGSLDPDSDPDADGFTWPTPAANTDTTLDDLWHAAYNSRGLYLSADNSEVLLDALLTAVADITDRETTAAAAAVTSAKLTTDTVVFLAEYNTAGWSGDIEAYKIVNFDTGELAAAPDWSAAKQLANRADPVGTRQIITYDNEGVKDGVPFQWDSLTEPMQKDLKTSCTNLNAVLDPPPGSCILQFSKYYCPVTQTYYEDICNDGLTTGPYYDRKFYCYDPDASEDGPSPANCETDDTDDKGKARLAYLRGDDSNEGAGYDFRERLDSKQENRILLGDIVNSGPVYVGAPALTIPDGGAFPSGADAYSKFKKAKKDRPGVVYAGANDGKFHAFDEKNGNEIFAYIPSYLFSTDDLKGMHYLTEKRYKHMFYNDLTATVADVFTSTGSGSGWRTVLVGGQRAGGRGYFALDVTDPTTFSEDKAADMVMWEMSSADDADLGYSYSRPQIGMMNDGTWVAIFGNGYNNDGDGKAKLFIVSLSGGVDQEWEEGTNYFKITAGTNGSVADPNGLGTPALADLDGNGTIDRAYAGDLNGDMWVFDLESGFGSVSATADYKLFTTVGKRPITTRPILSFHPTEPLVPGSNEPNLMVFFGSGQWLISDDKTTNYDEWFYGVWDKGVANLNPANLVEQTFRDGFDPFRVLTNEKVDYTLSDYGWKIQLDISGERSVTNPAVRGNVVLFNSTIPTTGPCSSGGFGYRFAVDIATGGSPEEPVLDIDKDGEIDDDDTLGSDGDVPAADYLSSLPTDNTFTDKVGYTGKDPFAIDELNTPQLGRFSWQELLQ